MANSDAQVWLSFRAARPLESAELMPPLDWGPRHSEPQDRCCRLEMKSPPSDHRQSAWCEIAMLAEKEQPAWIAQKADAPS